MVGLIFRDGFGAGIDLTQPSITEQASNHNQGTACRTSHISDPIKKSKHPFKLQRPFFSRGSCSTRLGGLILETMLGGLCYAHHHYIVIRSITPVCHHKEGERVSKEEGEGLSPFLCTFHKSDTTLPCERRSLFKYHM